MKKSLLAIAALPALIVVSCSDTSGISAKSTSKQDAESYAECPGYDGTKADPCRVSLYALIAQPERYDGMYLEVAGMYVEGLDTVLFADRDSAENSILKNGIYVATDGADAADKVAKNRNRFVTLAGFFSSIKRERSEFAPRDFAQFSGKLQVDRVGSATSAPIPYACWDPKRDRTNDPMTVKALLGEKVCDDSKQSK